jgi:Na+/melibiose symporter-like transporter
VSERPPGALRRNRDFVLFQLGQLLSSTGTQLTTIAYPLLVLAVTHSAARAGIVSFARALPLALFALPAGVAADRFDRKRLMIAADAVRAIAVAGLGAMVATHSVTFWAIVAIAFVEGAGSSVFGASRVGALRAVVPSAQLPAAISANTWRVAVVGLVGPPLGGALFGIARAVPFLADAASYAFSTVSLLFMRAPFQELRAKHERGSLREEVAEGLRFLWQQKFLRACALFFTVANFIGPGVLLALVVIARAQGLSAGEIGGLVAAFGAFLLAGSALSPLVRRLLPPAAVITLELWTWGGCALFLIWPSVYVLAASLLPAALAIPSTDSVVHSYGIAMTPDRLLGRAESVRSAIALAIAPLGPLLAGVMLASTSPRATIAVFAACGLALAVWGTRNPAIRNAPSLAELTGGQAAG